MRIKITSAGIFTRKQSFCQTTQCVFLGMVVSGLEKMNISFPDGQDAGKITENSLFLLPKGFTIDFAFNENRENYVIVCQIDNLHWNPQTTSNELFLDDFCLAIPRMITLNEENSALMRKIFRQVTELTASALPADAKAGELLAQSILSEFVRHSSDSLPGKIHPAASGMKQAIDGDVNFTYSLNKIMADFPFSPVRLRRLFHQAYHTTPAEYRARKRFSKIQELMSDARLSLKEIADAAGMNNVTHLNSFVKKQCGLTPAQLRKNIKL